MFIEENFSPLVPAELKFQVVFYAQTRKSQLNQCLRTIPTNKVRIRMGAMGTSKRSIVNRLDNIGLSLGICSQKNIDIGVKCQL